MGHLKRLHINTFNINVSMSRKLPSLSQINMADVVAIMTRNLPFAVRRPAANNRVRHPHPKIPNPDALLAARQPVASCYCDKTPKPGRGAIINTVDDQR